MPELRPFAGADPVEAQDGRHAESVGAGLDVVEETDQTPVCTPGCFLSSGLSPSSRGDRGQRWAKSWALTQAKSR